MNFKCARHVSHDGFIEYLFVGIEGWEDFDLVLSILVDDLSVTVISNDDLIWFRVASLSFQNMKFQLFFHEDAGNFLRLDKDCTEKEFLLKEVGEKAVEIIEEKVRRAQSQQ